MPKPKKTLKDLGEIAPQLGLEVSRQEPIHGRKIEFKGDQDPMEGLREPPMMYRAQVKERCNLQFAGDKGKNPHRTQWMKEWLQSSSTLDPKYKYVYEEGGDKTKTPIYSFKLKFSCRVSSNSGQDSIHRPVLGKAGIPYIPGSSVKGLFRRLLYSEILPQEDKDLVQLYCGNEEEPGKLRFHGAYPIGNWANQIVDVVHPQQARQVADNTPGSAFALLSFFEPEFSFEFSSADEGIDWKKVETLTREALRSGLGGKTSTGYGFADAGKPGYADAEHPNYAKAHHFNLQGVGVSSQLLNGNSEFRPNLFKATLRGHLKRLLGGVCNDINRVNRQVDYFMGSTEGEGAIQLFYKLSAWQLVEPKKRNEKPLSPAAHTVRGTLHVSASSEADLDFLTEVLRFAYVMGGFGKSWRRVWHKDFKQDYTRFHIGCHWTSEKPKSEEGKQLVDEIQPVTTKDELTEFLNDLHQLCQNCLSLASATPIIQWRESFHPGRVAVYCSRELVTGSAAIDLFHNNVFKTTRAIGGRDPHREHPQKVRAPGYTSHVWHRMLPIGKDASGTDQFLEIVTVFHGDSDRRSWMREGRNQLRPFLEALEGCFMTQAWGDPVRF
ncbi:RAMP superfamily CRISPR-associated protein [Nodosilinea nodulosa]|uniref:RAMP superfamily CRISPR-associated protein n=1 Tax=Nodosilinea nodulosa TaxID=416001 RepID=UPI0003078E9F|nr:RAMP superfamily CRISPR-associated protein [Nodosilinea nodulosa]